MAYVGIDTTLSVDGVSPGRVESAELSLDQSLEHLTGAGGTDSVIYSMAEPKGNATFWLQNTTLIAKALKTVINGLPPVIQTIQGGALGSRFYKQTSAYIDNLELTMEKSGGVKANVDWVALTHTTGDITVAPTALAKNLILAWHTACVTFGGQAFDCQSVSCKLENGLKLETDLDCKTAGVERMPTVVLPGNSKVSVELEFAAYPTVDVGIANPGTITLSWKAVNTEASPKTLLVTVTDLHPVGPPPVEVSNSEDMISYKISLETDYNSLSSFTFSLA